MLLLGLFRSASWCSVCPVWCSLGRHGLAALGVSVWLVRRSFGMLLLVFFFQVVLGSSGVT